MATSIEWTDETWNPLAGCKEVSPGCANCYAASMAHRLAAMAEADIAAGRDPGRKRHYIGLTEKRGGKVVWTGKINLITEALGDPLGWKKPRRVFVNSMSDLFHEAVPFEFVDRVFAAMALSRQHTFQVLTKRPDRMAEYFASTTPVTVHHFEDPPEVHPFHRQQMVQTRCNGLLHAGPGGKRIEHAYTAARCWPLLNVWLGTSVENQDQADKRIPHLLKCPAAVRFLSCEPLLGPVDLSRYLKTFPKLLDPVQGSNVLEWECPLCKDIIISPKHFGVPRCENGCNAGIDWVIVGGESGHNARPMHPDWARSLRDQCQATGVPFFFKQWGEIGPCPPSHAFSDQAITVGGGTTCGYHCDEENGHVDCGNAYMIRVGKKLAGRELDGRTWDEFPEVARG